MQLYRSAPKNRPETAKLKYASNKVSNVSPLEGHNGTPSHKGYPSRNEFLGHRNIKNTLVYIQLLPEKDAEYVVKVARKLRDAKILLECRFEYVTDMDNYKLFRKRN